MEKEDKKISNGVNKNVISKVFLIILIIFVIFACYLVFRPFLVEILAAAILVSIFYTPYEWLVKKFRNHRNLASLVMCLLVILIVIIPAINLIIYTAQRSVLAYSDTINFLNRTNLDGTIRNSILEKANLLGLSSDSLKVFVADMAKKSSNWLVSGAATLVKGTTSFIISLIIIVFTMFFFFVDGSRMMDKIMYWTPLSNKYDREIFKKFRDVSYSTMISTFVVAIAQGAAGAIGFMIVGLPAFFAGLLMGFFSLLPYIGAGFIWFPVAIYLLFVGKIWQGVFLLAWGVLVISVIDNLIRAYVIRGKAQVHPIFIILSILGGISLFGFWGVFLGPLIISIAITVFHIYELEYGEALEK
ncbi:MAG: AI-2E family transporter [Patescibacteria group bacterium]|nr:AI-2E family transporter [Patescibacteria group bacterium]MDD5294478.1 AI-2E family transporter [Patescibacteria group bacterium]MDD5554406.1 AI-2E family transporter [Patescibacteria group bacterium]